MEFVLGYITAADVAEARRLGQALVQARLAACANILPGMQSLYWWQGKLEEANEAVLLVKTRQELAAAVLAKVKELHSYECPCVVFLPVVGGNPAYLEWLAAETACPEI